MTGPTGEEWLRSGDYPKREPRRKKPKYGEETQMTKLLDVVRDPNLDPPGPDGRRSTTDAVAAITALYPSLQDSQRAVSAYVYDGRRRLARNEEEAQRLTFDFIREQHPSPQVPVEPQPRRPWWKHRWQRKGGDRRG